MNLLPYSMAVKIARAFGAFLFLILKRRRNITLENLRKAYPEKSEAEIKNIARNVFENLAHLALEFICIPKLARMNFIRNSNEDRPQKVLEQKKGLLLVISHLTSWEVMAVASCMAGLPMHAVARPIKNKFMYRYIKKLRGYGGLQSIDKTGALKRTRKLLLENQVICFMNDQHERQGSVQVQFFGRTCLASSFVAQMALRWDVPVIFMHAYRDQDNRVITDYDEPFKLVRTGNDEADAQANTQLFTKRIEERIRQMPGNWLWMHRRWRNS